VRVLRDQVRGRPSFLLFRWALVMLPQLAGLAAEAMVVAPAPIAAAVVAAAASSPPRHRRPIRLGCCPSLVHRVGG